MMRTPSHRYPRTAPLAVCGPIFRARTHSGAQTFIPEGPRHGRSPPSSRPANRGVPARDRKTMVVQPRK